MEQMLGTASSIVRNPTVVGLAATAFSDWFLEEPDTQVREELLAMTAHLADFGEEPLRHAAIAFDSALRAETPEVSKQNWTKAFALGAHSVTPHESVMRTGLVMQEPRDATLSWMRRYGVLPTGDSKEPEDHLGLQLALLAHICFIAAKADSPETEFSEAKHFAAERLAWIPILEGKLSEAGAAQSVRSGTALLRVFLEQFVRDNP